MNNADTLRTRLALWYLVALTLTLTAFAFLLHAWLSQTLHRHHDAELEVNALRLSDVLSAVPVDQERVGQALRAIASVPPMLMVRNRQGELIYRSPLLQVAEPTIGQHEALVHAAVYAPSDPEFFTATLERLGLIRFICVPISGVERAYLQVGNPLGDIPATLHAVSTASLVLIPIIVVVTSFGGWLIAGRALAPLAAIDATLRNIQATDLAKRVEVNPADRDLHSLVVTINGLLARLDRAFDDLRKFAADVSHQLQTPLTIVKGTIEFMRKGQHATQQTALLDDLDREVNDMSAIVSDLQVLSLADADLQAARRTELDLSALCREVLDVVTALAESRDVRVEEAITPGIYLTGQAVKLKQLVLNLGENAVKYTPPGGVVRVALHRDDTRAVLEVTDTGRGIGEADLPRIFDRFYRAAEEEHGVRGTGLGLAIVKRFVEVHDGSIDVISQSHRGTRFIVRLPLSDTASHR